MFETAILRKHGQAFTAVDAGLLAETLLFYSNVHIVAQQGVLTELLQTIGADTLLRLLEDEAVTFTYLRTDFGTVTSTINGLEFHDFGAMQLHKLAIDQKRLTAEEVIYVTFERAIGKSWHTRRLANRFLKKAVIRQRINVPDHPRGVSGRASEDLNDAVYVQEAIRSMLANLVPSYVPNVDFHFGVLQSKDSGFLIDHNIDMVALNAKFKEAYPSLDFDLTSALLIGQIFEARVDLQLACGYMAEVVTNPATGAVLRKKLASLMEKRDNNLSNIEIFQEATLDDARAIREAINSGEHSFEEFLKVLDQAGKFNVWLRSRNPDATLIAEYYKAVATETWVGKLPSKSVRFFLTTGFGVALEAVYPSGLSTAAGLALGAVDSLLLDRLLKGWRPNQFIQGPLQKFTS